MLMSTPQPARSDQSTAKATRLAYLVFERPDLDRAVQFLEDFGLKVCRRTPDCVLLRGTESHSYCYRIHRAAESRFVGMGFEFDGIAALSALARALPGSSIVRSKFGGLVLPLTDPSGFSVEAVCDLRVEPALPHRSALTFNVEGRAIRIDETQRTPVAPPDVLRLGHVVLEVAEYQKTCAWYTQHMGMIPSDVQLLPDGSPAVTFLRLDLGQQPADHHTLALAQGFAPLYSHSAYEVVDTDAVGMGQRLLKEKGWRHAWGMGRHVLGSQIFDYWQDPWGDKHEHYCDGDLFTADHPTGFHPTSRSGMAQWGQKMPASFSRPRITFRNIRALIHSLRASPDLSIGKLLTLARLFG